MFLHIEKCHGDEAFAKGSLETARRVNNLSCAGVRVVRASRLHHHLGGVQGLTGPQRSQLLAATKRLLAEVMVTVGDEEQAPLNSRRKELTAAFLDI